MFGFEALPRAAMREDPSAFAGAAVAAVHYTSPGLLFVPLASETLRDEGFDPFVKTEEVGASPAEVVWLIAETTALEMPDLISRRMDELRANRFQVALAQVGPGVLERGAVAGLLPNFVFLDPGYTDFSLSGVRARAELSGLLAYCARLNAHVVPRGIDDDATAHRMIGLGVRLGIGPHLGSPAVLEASWADPGDVVVAPGWFRQQGVHVLGSTGVALDTPALIASLPTSAESRSRCPALCLVARRGRPQDAGRARSRSDLAGDRRAAAAHGQGRPFRDLRGRLGQLQAATPGPCRTSPGRS